MCWSSFLSRNIIPLINEQFSALPRHLLQPSVMTSSLFFFFLWWSYRRVQHQTVSTKKIKKMKENRKIMNVARWYDFANLTFNLRALDCADSVFLSHQRMERQWEVPTTRTPWPKRQVYHVHKAHGNAKPLDWVATKKMLRKAMTNGPQIVGKHFGMPF